MCEFAVPISENEPRVPNPRPNVAGLLMLYVEFGLLKFGCFTGTMLLASTRIWNRTRSRTRHHFASETCVQVSPGPSNVLRPRAPGVKEAG